MSINKDINQQNYKSENQRAIINLIYTYNWITERLKAIFDKEGLTMQQFNILRILRGSDKPLSTLQIRERMLDKMSDTSRIVERLVKKDLVQKVVCKDDRRLVDITISDKGMRLLEELDHYNEEMDALLSNLNETEAKSLNQLLDKLRRSA